MDPERNTPDYPTMPTSAQLMEIGQVRDHTPYVLDPSKEWEPLQFSFSQNGIGIAPLGDVHVVKAPQKNGKTFLLTLLMGAMVKGEYLGLKCEVDNPRLLFIDTEQHPRNTQLVYRRVCQIAGIDGHERHDNLRFLHMRGTQVEEIRHAIRQEIVLYEPSIVYIDGLVDCVVDPNDQAESKAYITELSGLALKHNCSIWSVIHVNPGTDKMRGHLGTIMAQKSSDVLQCIKDSSNGEVIFTVEQTDTRNQDINKFSFCIENRKDLHNEFLAIPVPPYINVKRKEELNEIFQQVLGDKRLRSADLINAMVDAKICAKSKAYSTKTDAEQEGIIVQDPVTHEYRYVGLNLPNEDDMPF